MAAPKKSTKGAKAPASKKGSATKPARMLTEAQTAASRAEQAERLQSIAALAKMSPEQTERFAAQTLSFMSGDDVVAFIKKQLVLVIAQRADFEALPQRFSTDPPAWAFRDDVSVALSENRTAATVGHAPKLRVSSQFLGDAALAQPPEIGPWVAPFFHAALNAAAEATLDLVSRADGAELETNTLTWLGNRLSHHVRRELLLKELDATDWNLTATAERLRIGGAGALSRTIRDLGLSAEYAAARKRGAGKPGPKPKKRAEP